MNVMKTINSIEMKLGLSLSPRKSTPNENENYNLELVSKIEKIRAAREVRIMDSIL